MCAGASGVRKSSRGGAKMSDDHLLVADENPAAVVCQVTRLGTHARLSPHGATQDRLHPHRGRHVLQRSARRGHASRRARLRFRLDGRAPLGDEPLLAVAADGARRLRDAPLADNWIPGPTADLKRLLAGKKQFLDNRRAAGRTQAIAEWPLTRDLIIADTDRKARELAEEHIMIAYRKEYAGGWRHPFIDASIATDLDRLMADRFIVGGPEQCVAQVRRFTEEYGMTHLICRTFFPGMPHAHLMRELELIAREVAPAFR